MPNKITTTDLPFSQFLAIYKFLVVRLNGGLAPLKIIEIELIDEPSPKPHEETKISSSTTRMRLLGTLLKPVVRNDALPKKPYIIGLTGCEKNYAFILAI